MMLTSSVLDVKCESAPKQGDESISDDGEEKTPDSTMPCVCTRLWFYFC